MAAICSARMKFHSIESSHPLTIDKSSRIDYKESMESDAPTRVDAEFFSGLLLEMAQERSVEQLLRTAVSRVLKIPADLIAVIWLIDTGKENVAGVPKEQPVGPTRHLYAVAGGASITGPRELQTRMPDYLTRVPFGVGPIGKIAATGQPLTINDLDALLREFSPARDWLTSERIHGFNGVPIIYKGEMLGVYGVFDRNKPPDDALRWTRIFADHIAAVVVNARAFEEIRATGKRLEQVNQRLERELAERKEAEQKLGESEQRYRRIVDTASEGVWELDEHYTTTLVNRRMAEMLGYEPQEMAGRRLDEFLLEEDLADHQTRVAARQQGLAERFERRFRRKDGNAVWMQVSATPILDAEHRFLGSFAMMTDITERKRAEEEVRNTAAQWQATFDAVQDLVLLLDKDFRILRANRAAAEFLGLPFDRIIGGHCYDLIHGTSTPPAECALAKLRQSHRHEEVEILARKGGPWLAVSVDPLFDPSGELTQVVHVARDITDRKRAEEALRQSEAYLAEAQRLSHTGSWAFDLASDKYVYASEECLRIFGFDAREGLPTREAVSRLIHPEDWGRVNAGYEKSVREKVDTSAEFRITLPSGTIKHIQVIRHPILNDAGDVVKLVGTAIDVTERKQAEEELRKHRGHLEDLVKQRTEELAEAKARAETANREKSRFLANMSHELRTPLNAVLGFSRLLKSGSDVTPHQQEALDIIVRSGEHLLNLINNVLDMAKIESGRMVLEESEVDLHQLLHEMQSLMGVGAADKGLHFALEPDPDLPRFVAVDAGKLRQVLLNLVGNAIKYTESGGVKLRAEVVSRSGAETAQVRFEVEDSGPGIRPEDCQRIFFPFVQVGEPIPARAGTGLGLAICKQYVELMGGQIGVASEPGKGSAFYFHLPVRILPATVEPEEPKHGRVVGLTPGQPRYRLLIAEDQPENRLLLRRLLDPLGFELREAANGQEAVALFEQWQPDLIWMDIRMPVMDGMEAVRRIRATPSGTATKIIALTAHALEEERGPILAVGCDDLVRKPFREQELFDALARHLRLKFVYEKTPHSETASEAPGLTLCAEQLEVLPAELRQELRQAVIELDTARTQALIEQIAERDAALGRVLNTLATRLDYPSLLKWLEQGHSQTGEAS